MQRTRIQNAFFTTMVVILFIVVSFGFFASSVVAHEKSGATHYHCSDGVNTTEVRLRTQCLSPNTIKPHVTPGGDVQPNDPANPTNPPRVDGTTFERLEFINPMKFDNVEGLLGQVLTTVQSLVAVLAILFIVIGALIYITSAGDSGRIELAKKAIGAALIGLILAVIAPSLLKEIYGALSAGGNVNVDPNIVQAPTLSEIALNVLKLLLSLVGILSIIMIVIGGIFYITAAGDEGRVDSAKKTILYAIIGLVVALVSLVVVTQVVGTLGGGTATTTGGGNQGVTTQVITGGNNNTVVTQPADPIVQQTPGILPNENTDNDPGLECSGELGTC